MSDLSPFSRDLLARSRVERTPNNRARERVFDSVVASGVLSTASAVAAPSLAGKLALVAGKWWLLAGVCVALVGGGGRLAFNNDTSPRPATAVVARPAFEAVNAQANAPKVTAPAEPLPQAPAAPATTSASEPTRERGPSAARLDGLGTQLEQDVSLLHAAHDAYGAGRPAQALALIARHRARFPKSQLTSERATLEVLALCRVGRVADAQRLAAQLRGLSGLEGSCAAPK